MHKIADLDIPEFNPNVRRPCAKPSARVAVVKATKREDAKQAAAFRAAVWKRDEGKCRLCGRRCLKTLALVPNAGHVHHIKGRNVAPEDRYNVKKALLLCAEDHAKAQRHEVKVPKP